MITIASIIFGIVLVIQGKAPVFGARIVEGKSVRLLGTAIIILSIFSFFTPVKFHRWIFGFEILILIIFYYFVKGRKRTDDEKKDSFALSKNEEADMFKGLIKGILITVAVLGVLSVGIVLILKAVVKGGIIS